MMIALTVDIEDWYHVPAVTGSPFAKYRDVDEFFNKWDVRYDYLSGPTNRVLEILERYKIKATFFIVADIVEHYPGLVATIASKGHEIACHGLHHACKIHPKTKKPLVTREEFETRTLKAKQMLEDASGQKVKGYRAPSAYIAGWMLDSLEQLGFEYDSSVAISSFYNKSDSSLTNVTTVPYYPDTGQLTPGTKRAIKEFPWPYYKLGFKLPTGGGPLLRMLGGNYCCKGLKQSLGRGDTVFYFHPLDISQEKFPNSFSIKRPFYWAIKGQTVEKRLKQILDQYNSLTCTVKDLMGK